MIYKVKLMPVRIIQIELIQHWCEKADGMNFSFPFSPLSHRGGVVHFLIGFFVVVIFCLLVFVVNFCMGFFLMISLFGGLVFCLPGSMYLFI